MLYSIGKDSSVMLRLAQKAFYPGPIPFPLLHIDTGFKFREMLAFRDEMARSIGARLLVWRNEPAIAAGTNPIVLDTKRCCGLLKTQALLDALRHYNFDAAFGGARRDEEKSRAKERIYSFRDRPASGIPRTSAPNSGTSTTRAFIPAKASAFSRSPTGRRWTCGSTSTRKRSRRRSLLCQRAADVRAHGCGSEALLPIEQEFVAFPGEKPQLVKSRLRSLGCSPCTGAIRSDAETIPDIIAELVSFRSSERANRAIDHDQEGSMEIKKREGYF